MNGKGGMRISECGMRNEKETINKLHLKVMIDD